jgi:peptidoglycan/xylan/chitin deacetylase (PgdA/CDA1 family)
MASIDESGSVISVTPRNFERQMEAQANGSARVVPLSEVRGTAGAIALTFDDGFRNFRTIAAPLLERYGFPATVFVVSGFCGKNNQWPGQAASVPQLPLMDWAEVREIADRGFTLGAHTVNHPDLCKLAYEDATREMQDCKSEIEHRLGRPVTQFSYPYGRIPDCARPPFQLACGTRLAFLSVGDDPLDLPRIDTYYLRSEWPGSLLSDRAAAYFGARGILRNLRQWLSQ